MGDHVDFYEVDGGCARELVALADVRNFPVSCCLWFAPRCIGAEQLPHLCTPLLTSAHLCTPLHHSAHLCTPASPHSTPQRMIAPSLLHSCTSALLQVTQIYARGALRTTCPINSKALFDEFNAGLVDLVLEFADFSVTRGKDELGSEQT